MKNLTKSWRVIAMGAVIISLSMCATTVQIKSVRQPTIPTGDIQRLAIRPFENKSGTSSSEVTQLTQHLSDSTRQQITGFGKFTIVAPTDPNAEGIFLGEVRSYQWVDSESQSQRKDKEGNVTIVTTYRRDVSLSFMYQVISTRTSMPVGEVIRQGSDYSTSSDRSSLTSPIILARRIVDSQLRRFLQQDVVPVIVSTNRKLMEETSKDKAIKQRMKDAKALVKSGNYDEAIRQYDEIAGFGSVAASTNANLLREAISSDVAARAELAALFEDTGGVAEKAAKNAITSLNAKLPAGTTIMIMKTSSTDRGRIDYAMDQMTKTVVQEGRLKVVDRTNQALINAEQQYQLSGNVDDKYIVGIGHELGAQYIVLCWISGEMSMRRLNVRVLNVETAQVTDQNDYEI